MVLLMTVTEPLFRHYEEDISKIMSDMLCADQDRVYMWPKLFITLSADGLAPPGAMRSAAPLLTT